MRIKTTISAVCFCVILWFSGLTPTTESRGLPLNLTEPQPNRLYEELRKRNNDPDRVLSQNGLLVCDGKGENLWVVWLSTGSPIGAGLIGTFDKNSNLVSVRETRPLLEVKSLTIRGIGETVLVLEQSSSGTGVWSKALSLLDPKELKTLWSQEVESWEEGIEGRNVGHMIQHSIALIDVDNDGTDELIDIETAQYGTDLEPVRLDERNVPFKIVSLRPEITERKEANFDNFNLIYPEISIK